MIPQRGILIRAPACQDSEVYLFVGAVGVILGECAFFYYIALYGGLAMGLGFSGSTNRLLFKK